MAPVPMWRRYLCFWGPNLPADVDTELRFHLEMLTERYLAEGMAPADARAQARRRFGDVHRVRSECLKVDQRWETQKRRRDMFDELRHDARYGVRMLAKSPGFASVAVLTLALGIGATTAIFSVVDAVLLRPLPYAEPDRLVRLWQKRPPPFSTFFALAPANFLDWKEQNQVFENMAAIRPSIYVRPILTGVGEPELIEARRVSANFFQILGAAPSLGRTFLPEEDRPEGEPVVILSQGLWQRRFGSDPHILGRTLTLTGEPHTVVGVMPGGFNFIDSPWAPTTVELWLPDPFRGIPSTERRLKMLRAIARLKPGVTLERAQAEMDTIALRQEAEYPDTNKGWGAFVNPFHGDLVQSVRPALLLLLGAVSFVLLIACVNVANLLLARSMVRQRELAIRAAVGAGRRRLLRQLLTESVLLALAGGALGIVLARWGVASIVAVSPATIPRLDEVSLDARVLGFTLLTCLATSVVFGLVPALRGSRPDLNEFLKEGGVRAMGSRGRHRARGLLVAAEIGLALILLIGGALLLDTFLRLQSVELGFNSENLLAMEVSLPREKYAEATGFGRAPQNFPLWTVKPQHTEFVSGVVERLERVPGVKSAAAIIAVLPLDGTGRASPLLVEGRQLAPPQRGRISHTVGADGQPDYASFLPITPDYFSTMGIPLLRGRMFTERDGAGAPGVAIVNETMARRVWPDKDPIGKRLQAQDGFEDEQRFFEVVGVVGDVRLRGFSQSALEMEPQYVMYFPSLQQASVYAAPNIRRRMRVNFVVGTSADFARIGPALRSAVWEVDDEQPIQSMFTMDEYLSEKLQDQRFVTVLIGSFSAMALLLAMLGIYGVMSYSVSQRTHEIGVRMALGAGQSTVLRMVLGQGFIVTLTGIALGVAGAFALTRVLASFLYGVSATDPVTFAGASLLMVAVALVACYVPARRATKIDPLVALRSE